MSVFIAHGASRDGASLAQTNLEGWLVGDIHGQHRCGIVGAGAVFWVENGTLHHVPSPQTREALFDETDVHMTDLTLYSCGEPIENGMFLQLCHF